MPNVPVRATIISITFDNMATGKTGQKRNWIEFQRDRQPKTYNLGITLARADVASLTNLSDELILKILGLLDTYHLLACQRVCYRFYQLASDDQIWKRAFMQSFEAPRGQTWGGVAFYAMKDHCYLSRWDYKTPRWQKKYKAQYNWRRGICHTNEIFLPSCQPGAEALMRRCGYFAFTADELNGLQVWRDRNSQLSNEASMSLASIDVQAFENLSAMEISASRDETGTIHVCLGFSQGSVAIIRYLPASRRFMLDSSERNLLDDMIHMIALSFPYVALVTKASDVSILHIGSEEISDRNEAKSYRLSCISSLNSRSIRKPIDLAIRISQESVTVTLLYPVPNYTTHWSVGVQEIYLSETNGPYRSRQATSERCYSFDKRILLSHQEQNCRTRSPIQLLSYSHPFLVTAQADNSMALYKITSTSSQLAIHKLAELWGHTSRVKGLCVSRTGKAVSIGAEIGDVKIWDFSGSYLPGVTLSPLKMVGKNSRDFLLAPRQNTRDFASDIRHAVDFVPDNVWVYFDEEHLTVYMQGDGGTKRVMLHTFS